MAMDPGAMPPQGAPAEAAPAEEGGGDQFADLVSNITDGLGMLMEVLSEVSPEVGAELEGVSQAFQATISKAMGGGAAPQGQGQVSPEASRGGAVPVGPQGVARG